MKRFCLVAVALLIFSAHANADVTYTIKKGDTLSRISKKLNVSAKEISSLNNLKKSSKLKIGQTLTVRKTGPMIYTVRKGDSINRIAKKFNIDAMELKDINLLGSDSLKPGQKLLLESELEIETAKINLEEEIKNILESEEIAQMNAKDRLILFAKKFINIPYKFGGNSIMGIDCSAYVQRVYSLIGITIPRSARLQFKEGEIVDRDSLSIGDLVFFRTYASFPSHVGIYLGNDLFIHSPSKGKKVSIDSLKTPYYFKRFIGGKRFIIDNAEIEITKQLHEG
ncbi:MAG: LysM peptidoglycan-binding domain-containing protein [Thermodesulfovibrionales bacterium]|nr:LysM peptidoglycan-binding domain-containing protein [Thermodesulfovibrionales bacterium]